MKKDTEAYIWDFFNRLRGKMNGQNIYKLRMPLGVLFYIKYICEQAKLQPDSDITIPDSCNFSTLHIHRGNPNIGYEINEIIRQLTQKNPQLHGVLNVVDFKNGNFLPYANGDNVIITMMLELIETISSYSFDEVSSNQNYSELFELLMNSFEVIFRKYNEFQTPNEIGVLIAELCSASHLQFTSNVYDPACGEGNLLHIVSNKVGTNMHIYGQDINEGILAFAKLRMLFLQNGNASLVQGDTLNDPKFVHDNGEIETFDLVVTEPPFSLRKWKENDGNDVFNRWNDSTGIPSGNNSDFAFLLHIISSMNQYGKAFCIFPSSILFYGGVDSEIRQYIIESGVIEGIINLPPKLFKQMNIQACLIILDKSKALTNKGIFVIDARQEFVTEKFNNRLDSKNIRRIVKTWSEQNEINDFARFVSMAEIRENNYDLSVTRYLINIKNIDIPDGFKLIKLGEILTPIKRSRPIEPSGTLIRLSDLSSDILNYELKPQEIANAELRSGCTKLTCPALLIAKRFNKLRPSTCWASESEPVYLMPEIEAFEYDKNLIITQCLVVLLNSNFVERQVEAYSKGVTIPSIRTEDILNISILFPALEDDQYGIINDALMIMIKELSEKNTKNESVQQNSFEKNMHLRKHALAQVLNKFSPEFALLKRCKDSNNGKLSDDMIVATRTGETVEQCFANIEKLANKLELLIDKLVDDKSFGEPEWIWIETFIEDYIKYHNQLNYPVRFNYKRQYLDDINSYDRTLPKESGEVDSIAITFPKNDLIQVFDNILVNADKYGFIKRDRLDYEVLITLGHDIEKKQVVISISNNGEPLHDRITPEKLFTWGGGDGSGLGLWQVRNIVEHFNGKVEFVSKKDDMYPVEIRLLFPTTNSFS